MRRLGAWVRVMLWLGPWVLLVGCTSPVDSGALLVDVRTDLVPREEFVAVVVRARAEHVVHVVRPDEATLAGIRVAELAMAPGDVDVDVELIDALGDVVLERRIRTTVDGVVGITVTFDRSCVGVACEDGACLDGVCVAPTCTSGSEADCGPPACEVDAECAASGCALPRCVEGVCLEEGEGCAEGSYCVPESGCEPVAETVRLAYWADVTGGPAYEELFDVTVLADGSRVAVGAFRGTLGPGEEPLVAADVDGLVIAWDAAGERRWARAFGGAALDRAYAVAAAPDGGVFVAGEVTGESGIGDRVFPGGGGADAFVARLGSDGEVRWARTLGEDGEQRAWALVAHPEEGVVVVGDLAGRMSLESGELVAEEPAGFFVHLVEGVARAGANLGPELDRARAVAVDEERIYVGGGIGEDAVVTCASGCDWSAVFGGAGEDLVHALALRRDRLYAGGAFATEIAAAESLRATGASDGFVLALDARTGAIQGGTAFGGDGRDAVTSLDTFDGAPLFVAGSFAGRFAPGDGTTHESEESAPFVLAAGHDQTVRWSRHLRADEAGGPAAVALQRGSRNVVVAGSFRGVLEAEPQREVATMRDGYVVAFREEDALSAE